MTLPHTVADVPTMERNIRRRMAVPSRARERLQFA